MRILSNLTNTLLDVVWIVCYNADMVGEIQHSVVREDEVQHAVSRARGFGYSDMEHAPQAHRDLARMLGTTGLSQTAAASLCGLAREQVNRICQHPPFAAAVDHHRAETLRRIYQQAENLSLLVSDVVGGLRTAVGKACERLEAEDLDAKELTYITRNLLATLREAADRIPGGVFARTERREERRYSQSEQRHVTGSTLDALRARAKPAEPVCEEKETNPL